MSWGKAKQEPPPSAFSKVLPLIILFVVLAVFAFIAYHIINIASTIADNTSKKLEKKNVLFTRDGMKVGVKEIKDEHYADRTQRFVDSPGLDGQRIRISLLI